MRNEDPTNSGTSAVEAFGLKRGVCQDYAHIFIACARSGGVPARFVAGHFLRSDGMVNQQAGHAWAEAFVPDLGWVGFDPANAICTTDAHARVAIGLDYLGAAPVRGTRYGGGMETLSVKVKVDQAGDDRGSGNRSLENPRISPFVSSPRLVRHRAGPPSSGLPRYMHDIRRVKNSLTLLSSPLDGLVGIVEWSTRNGQFASRPDFLCFAPPPCAISGRLTPS